MRGNDMKKIYTEPELSVLNISSADIITTSGGLLSFGSVSDGSSGHTTSFEDFGIY